MAAEKLRIAYLQQQLALAQRAASALSYSSEGVSQFVTTDEMVPIEQLTDAQQERLEALAARFARLSDILIQKLFRAVDAIELVDEGTILDRLQRMEKRAIIQSAAEWRQIRELRNQVAHDYVVENLSQFYAEILAKSPLLIALLPQLEHYLLKQKVLLGC
ncbi:MAG: hypothetical protein L3J28_04730 [Candidatus Polarisedimenticolaceae bacterium]|nr:hypothetical protein [Candidatus Polarisedimenticolaceae bacterium]